MTIVLCREQSKLEPSGLEDWESLQVSPYHCKSGIATDPLKDLTKYKVGQSQRLLAKLSIKP